MDDSTSILHPTTPEEGVPPAPSPIEVAATRTEARKAALRKAQLASAKARKEKAAANRARKATRETAGGGAGAAAAPDDDPVAAAVKKQLRESPVKNAKDLAQLIAKVEESLAAVAPIAGPKGVFLVRALQWSDGKGNPTQQCAMAAGFMWPWLHKQDVFGQLAAASDGLMFTVGCTMLMAPFVGAIVSLFLPRRPEQQPAETANATAPDARPLAVA